MLQITVVHTLSPEVIELLKGLFKHGTEAAPSVPAVTQQPAAAEKPVAADKPVTEKPKPKATPAVKAEVKDLPVENQHGVSDFEKQEAPKDEAPATPGKAYTLEEVRAAAVAKTQESEAKREAVKALIKGLGATAISTLNKEHYSLFMTKLNAI